MNNEVKYINVSKLDAAKRQLEFSIKLFFMYGDVVIIHALASAGHEVLWRLCKKQGIKSILKDEFMEMIKPTKKKEVKKMINEAQNFFKHAGNDSDQQLKFFFNSTQYTIFDACLMYKQYTNENNALMHIFLMWFYINNPEILVDASGKELIENSRAVIDPKNRTFFLQMLPDIENKLIPH